MLYTKTHEWVKIQGNIATIGISEHAQSELGEVVYVEQPAIDTTIAKDEQLLVIESVKAASDIYAPIPGKIIKFNDALEDTPELINESPLADGSKLYRLVQLELDYNYL